MGHDKPLSAARYPMADARRCGKLAQRRFRRARLAGETKERKRAEAQFKKEERATEGAKAMSEYRAEARSQTRQNRALKALRLAKEASDKVG
jgi:hypothetical protein